MSLFRVFPRRTKATPDDDHVIVGREPGLFDRPDTVHVSCTFTWDLPLAEHLAESWSRIAPTELGGPATGMRGENFKPGMYLRKGYVITSRGCPNRCWFCSVWRREGNEVRELPIRDGYNVLDDNLLACSEGHIRAVFAMLSRQPDKAEFTGGLEAARLQDWHVHLLAYLKPKQMFFAYDTPDDYEPLVEAGRKLLQVYRKSAHVLRAYVLVGYPKDTFEAAEQRLRDTWDAGFFPMAMLWNARERPMGWKSFQRQWANPWIIHNNLKRGAASINFSHSDL